MVSNTHLGQSLRRQSGKYKNTWQRLPESLELPEPFPVTSVLCTFEGNREKKKETFDTPQEAVQAAIYRGAGVVLVEAGPGQGKTSSLLWAAHLACEELLAETAEDTDNHIPWFKNLGVLTKTGDAHTTLEGIHSERPKAMRDRKGMFFLDGLDLLTGRRPDAAGMVVAAIQSSEDEGHIYVLSGRPLSHVKSVLDDEGESYRIELAGLDSESVDKWLEEYPQIQNAVEQICHANPSATSLRDTPLLFGMMVSAANATSGGREPVDCSRYPGRAGLFNGFVNHLIERAWGQQNPPDGERSYSDSVLEGLCWAALTAGHMEVIPGNNLEELLDRALLIAKKSVQPLTPKEAKDDLKSSVEVLRKAGIVLKHEADKSIRFIHQEFMEHLGGKHLARRLNAATEGGWLEAELWDHLDSPHPLDNLLGHGLAQMQDDSRPKAMDLVPSLLESYAVDERIAPLISADPMTASSIAASFLDSEKPEERESAVIALSWIGTPNCLELLIDVLQRQDEELSWAAAYAMGRIKAPEVVNPLIRALRDPIVDVREHAADALGMIKDPKSVVPLVKALGDQHEKVIWAAARALGEIKDSRAVKPLIQVLWDQNKDVYWAAAQALGEIKDPSAVDSLIQSSKGQDDFTIKIAIGALGEIKDSRASAYLFELLRAQDLNVRWGAALALKKIEDSKAVDTLIKALQDKGKGVCWTDAEALGKMEDSRAVGPLIQALQDRDEKVRQVAARALEELKDSKAVEPLIEALGDQDLDVRWTAAEALGEIKDPIAVLPLIQALRDLNECVRGVTAEALGKINDSRALNGLINALNDQHEYVRKAAANALGLIQDSKAVGPLIEALQGQDKHLRLTAAKALGEIKDPQAVGPLIEALQGQDEHLRLTAAKALGQIKDPKAVEPLIQILRNRDKNVFRNAAYALGKIWGNISNGDPMSELHANAGLIPREIILRITYEWGRRWTSLKSLEKIDKQREKRTKEEEAMGKGGNVIIHGDNNGPVNTGENSGNMTTIMGNYYEAKGLTPELLALLRQDLKNKEAFKPEVATWEEVLAKLDELIEAVRTGAEPEAVKGPWVWLQNAVNVATLSEKACKVWEMLEKLFPA